MILLLSDLSGTGRFATQFTRIDSREPFAIETPIFIARQADSHESLESCESIRANHATEFLTKSGNPQDPGKEGLFQGIMRRRRTVSVDRLLILPDAVRFCPPQNIVL